MQVCDSNWVAGVARIPWPLSRMPQNSKAISQSSRPSAWTPRPPRGTACCRRVARHVIWDFGGHTGRAHAPALHCRGVQPVDEVSARVSQVGLLPKTRCNCRNHRFRLCLFRKVLRHPAAAFECERGGGYDSRGLPARGSCGWRNCTSKWFTKKTGAQE